MNLSDFMAAGAKPKLITLLTSGTGTYVPTADNARCFVRVQGGGASGATGAGGMGGGAGAMVEGLLRIPIAGVAYTVGAGGAATSSVTGNDGILSRFGSLTAAPGLKGYYGNVSFYYSGKGGVVDINFGNTTSTTNPHLAGGGNSGVSGGGGGAGSVSPARAAGFPMDYVYGGNSPPTYTPVGGGATAGTYAGGGDSYFGIGASGHATVAPDGTGYGYGGGSAATTASKGGGGCIEIWDFGA